MDKHMWQLFFSVRVGGAMCHHATSPDLQLHALIGRDGKCLETKLETPTLIEVWRTAPISMTGDT